MGHFALDIGGSLIKIVYFTPGSNAGSTSGGRLHFVKFETSKVDLALDFIEQKQLHLHSQGGGHKAGTLMRIKATGGGAYKFADAFKRRLGCGRGGASLARPPCFCPSLPGHLHGRAVVPML